MIDRDMRNQKRFIYAIILNIILLYSTTLHPVHSESAGIVLSPEEGLSAFTIKGSGFRPGSTITVYWDSNVIPTVPLKVSVDNDGTFTCMASVYDQSTAGEHEIKVVDSEGIIAKAIFTVVKATGPQGEQGPTGTSAVIPPGYLAGLLLLAIAAGALTGSLVGRARRKQKGAGQN